MVDGAALSRSPCEQVRHQGCHPGQSGDREQGDSPVPSPDGSGQPAPGLQGDDLESLGCFGQELVLEVH